MFRKARIKAFASGENTNTLPVDEDVLRRGAKTIYNKPILWKYNPYFDDAEGHEEDEVPCGFVPEINNPIEFEREPDGRLFIVINAYIWTRYSGRLMDIIKRDGFKKSVSIEMLVVDKDNSGIKTKILDFVITGITILGEWVNPACKGAELEMLEFSEAKAQFDEARGIKIDNSKDSAVDGSWSAPRRGKLFKPIVDASNTASLFNEAYLVNESVEKDSTMAQHKYPHHVIKNGTLVVHKGGLQAAFSRASQQGIVSGKVKAHLLKHYRELGLDTSNFAEFGISKEDFEMYFSEEFGNNKIGDEKMNFEELCDKLRSHFSQFTYQDAEGKDCEKYSVKSVEDGCVTCSDNERGCMCKMQFTCDGDKVEVDMASIEDCPVSEHAEVTTQLHDIKEEGCKQMEIAKEAVFEEGKPAEKKEVVEVKESDDPEVKPEEKEHPVDMADCTKEEFEALKEKCMSLEEENKRLKADNEAYMAKCDEMSDYEELKKFKEDTIAEQKKQEEMAQMEKVMSEIESRGVEMSGEDKEALIAKFSEFSSIDAWSNYVKASVFDRIETSGSTLKIGLPFSDSGRKGGSIWDKF